jgi:hypothetical protein
MTSDSVLLLLKILRELYHFGIAMKVFGCQLVILQFPNLLFTIIHQKHGMIAQTPSTILLLFRLDGHYWGISF